MGVTRVSETIVDPDKVVVADVGLQMVGLDFSFTKQYF